MINNLTPIQTCDSLPNIGGILRLRIAYSKDILQQKHQSDSELDSLVFLRGGSFIADYNVTDKITAGISVESFLTEYGSDTKQAIKFSIDNDSSPQEFSLWYERKVRNRRLALEITNMNGFVRTINPFFLTYKHIIDDQYSIYNKYELSFTKASLINNLKDLENNSIKTLEVICPPFSDGFGDGFQSDILTTVHIHLDIDIPALYQFGYSTQNDFRTVANWQIGDSKFTDVPEGSVIYFFAENIYLPDMPYLTSSKYITCAVCELEILSVTETLVGNADPLVDDWEDVASGEETDPLVDNWEDIATTEETNPLEDNWEDVANTGCEVEIESVTELIIP